MPKEDLSMGVEWGYLKSLLNYHGVMVALYSKFLLSTKNLAHPRERLKFMCAMSVFYSNVKYSFDSWLKNNDKKDMIKQYEEPPADNETLKNLYHTLNTWTQSAGPFKTLVKNSNPFEAFKNG